MLNRLGVCTLTVMGLSCPDSNPSGVLLPLRWWNRTFCRYPGKRMDVSNFKLKALQYLFLATVSSHYCIQQIFTCYLLCLYHVHKTDNTVHSTYTTTSNTKQQLTIEFHSAQILEILDQ